MGLAGLGPRYHFRDRTFFVGELVASRVLFALNIRDRPY